MEKFTKEINDFTNNKFDFMLKSALLDKAADFCVVEILYKDGVMISQNEKKKLRSLHFRYCLKNMSMNLISQKDI